MLPILDRFRACVQRGLCAQSVPVDMQNVIHSSLVFQLCRVVLQEVLPAGKPKLVQAIFRQRCCSVGLAGKSLPWLFCANSVNRFTVKQGYTRIVVVVNAGQFLWISRFLSTQSSACTFYKAVNDPVLGHGKSWIRFSLVVCCCFVHNRHLWICRTLSTAHARRWRV